MTPTADDPTAPDATSVGRVLGALADGTRRDILERLAGGATPTATELAAELPITRQAVAKHLRVLADADLVDTQRRGREARYALRPDQLDVASRWLDAVGSTWERRLEALKRHAEAEAGP